MNYRITAMYHFADFPEFESFRQPLLDFCNAHTIKGTLLLADEGINGTVAGSHAAIEKLLAFLQQQPQFAELGHKSSIAEQPPFLRMKVKLKKEIVTLGINGVSPKKVVGTYVKPHEWNQLIQDPDIVVIDTRNTYETQIGTFTGAIDPKTTTFREFPQFVNDNLDKTKHKKVAMFCTGGIRCEKASSFMLEQGFEEVYHLQGGILQYLEDVAPEQSLWQGECFVFDERVTVKHDLTPGNFNMCHACRLPLSQEELQHPDYKAGVACQYCADKKTPEQQQRYAERQKQIQLAKQRHEPHLGRQLHDRSQQQLSNTE